MDLLLEPDDTITEITLQEFNVHEINRISKEYKDYRQKSKAPTFALTYSGTYITLMKNCGFSEDVAKQIEAGYHELYAVADAWIANLIVKAETCGYIPLAFGGRIRTPLISQSAGKGQMRPYAAKDEERSAGNAATQSYCVLTLRAMVEFMERVWASPYKYEILPTATIHDAIYPMIKDSAKCLKWVNDNLIECMAWQDLPELYHPTIRISSGLEVYWPSWARGIPIPNNASEEEIKAICDKAKKETNNNEK